MNGLEGQGTGTERETRRRRGVSTGRPPSVDFPGPGRCRTQVFYRVEESSEEVVHK